MVLLSGGDLKSAYDYHALFVSLYIGRITRTRASQLDHDSYRPRFGAVE